MTLDEIMNELRLMGNDATKNTLVKHGAREPFFGVKVEDLKKIQKKVKYNHELALALYRTGNSDAMYLAGLIAEPLKMTESDLQEWVEKAYWYWLSEYTVPWVASESLFGLELALKWIDSGIENTASTGWATLGSLVAIKKDEEIDAKLFSGLLNRVADTIHQEQNHVRRAMNNFVIAVGGYCTHLSPKAHEVAETIGKVNVVIEGTSCKVPLATEYIEKMKTRGTLGKKRKSARC